MKNTRRNLNNKLSKTMKNNSSKQYSIENIIVIFMSMLTTIKLYHWKTFSYPEHKATDDLYSSLNENIDNFVETMLGKMGGRFNLKARQNIQLMDLNNVNKLKKEVEKYKIYLTNMSIQTGNDSDLLNIRDEMLSILNKFSYLLTLH